LIETVNVNDQKIFTGAEAGSEINEENALMIVLKSNVTRGRECMRAYHRNKFVSIGYLACESSVPLITVDESKHEKEIFF